MRRSSEKPKPLVGNLKTFSVVERERPTILKIKY